MGAKKWSEIRHDRPAQPALAESALPDLRRERKTTQAVLAGELGVSQSAVSQMENGGDMKLTTLRDYVAGLGGLLRLEAVFDDATYELPTYDVGAS
jgi:transcriptional regulator with XRE-family HTH domain